MTLGNLLKSRREELGKSIEQISVATKIHIKVLTAIENDLYGELPARTFTRGFIAADCKALRLNADQTLIDYHDFLESKFAERPDRDQGHQGYVFEGKELEQNRRWLIFGASVAGIFAIAVLLVFKPQNHKRKEKHKEFAEETVAAEGSETPDGDGIPKPVINNSATDGPNGAMSSLPLASNASTPHALNLPIAAVTASPVVAVSTPAPTTASPTVATTPTSTPTPAVTAVAASTPMPTVPATSSPTPTPSSSPSPSTSPSPTPKEDKLNKGDELTPAQTKRKITFQAQEDTYVRYQADQKPASTLILRKGRLLVIKAKEKIRVETNKPEALKFKGKGSAYEDVGQAQFSVDSKGGISSEGAGTLGTQPLPDSVPESNSR